MKSLKLLIFATITSFVLSCCSSSKTTTTTPVAGSSMWNEYNREISIYQFDSICTKDTLSNDLNDWIVNGYKDYETGKVIRKYLYMKKCGHRDVVYILTGEEEPFKIVKRITE